MVCKEDVVTWFKELTSHRRIDVMCTLLNMCLPFELRFLGTCLEDLGKRDFHDLRDAENRANNVSELSDLHCISDKRTQRKLALYLSLLHSCNHACSNGLYKILANFDFGEINTLANSSSSEENAIDELLLLYTLALNHPAFTYEQRAVFGNILLKLQEEENKLYAARHSVSIGLMCVKNPIQPCVPCPSSEQERGQIGPCSGLAVPPAHPAADVKGRNSLPPGLNLPPGLTLPPDHHPMTATSYVHVTFPSAGHQPIPAVPWHGSVGPLMMTGLCSTLPGEVQAGGEVSPYPSSPLMSRQSSPSQSGSPSRAASPTRLLPPPPPPPPPPQQLQQQVQQQPAQQPQSQQQQVLSQQAPQTQPQSQQAQLQQQEQQRQQTQQHPVQQQPAQPQQVQQMPQQVQQTPQVQQLHQTQQQQQQQQQSSQQLQQAVTLERAQNFKRPPPVQRPERNSSASSHRQNCIDMPPPPSVGQHFRGSLSRKSSSEPGDSLRETLGKEMPNNMQILQKFSAEELRRMGDEEFKASGLPLGAVHQLRSIVNKLNATNGICTLDKREPTATNRRKDAHEEVSDRKSHSTTYIQSYSGVPLEGSPVMCPPSLLSASAAPCFTCIVPVSAPNRYPPQPQQYYCMKHSLRGLRIEGDASRHCSNSSSAASDSSSASHSPPETPSMPTPPQWERGYTSKDCNIGERWSPGCEEHGDKERRVGETPDKVTEDVSRESQPPGTIHCTPVTTASVSTNNNINSSNCSSSNISTNTSNSSNSSNTNNTNNTSNSSNSSSRPRLPGLGRGKSNPPGLQTLPRGRGPNPTTVILEGNHKTLPSCRREGSAMNGAQAPPRSSHPPPTPPHEDRKMFFVPSDIVPHAFSTVNSTSQPPQPPSQYTGGSCGSNPHRPAEISGGSSNVPYSPATAAAAFLPHTHFNALRSNASIYPSFAPSNYMRPFPFSPNGDLVYQYHGPQTPPPPPPTFIPTPMVAAFSTVVPPPKVSCYNCGSQSHHASDCKDPTMEEVTKPGQYRIDYGPYQKPGECSTEK